MSFPEESSASSPSRGSGDGDGRPAPESLQELGRRFVRRDSAAFEEVYRLLRDPVYVIGVLELGDVEEARDLVQETFRRAWSSAATLREPGQLRPWLFAIARNVCIDLGKRSQRRPRPVAEVPDRAAPATGPDAPVHSAILREKARRVRQLLASVPESFRQVLALRLLQERSYQEISEILGLPLHGVKNAVARGGRLLVEKLRNSPELDPEGEP